MSLQAQFKYHFTDHSRLLGAELFNKGKCVIPYGDSDSVQAEIQEEEETLSVFLDRERRQAGVNCDCDLFESGEFCHHIWAALLLSDQKGDLRDRYGKVPLDLIADFDEEDFDEF